MSTRSFRKSFGFKVFRTFVLSVLVVATVLSGFLVSYQSGVARKDLNKEGTMLTGILAYNIRTWVFAENREMLKDAVQGVMGQRNVLAVVVYNADRQVLMVEKKRASGGKPASPIPEGGEKFLARAGAVPRSDEDDNTIGFLSPVVFETYRNMDEALYFGETQGKGVQNVIGYVEVVLDKGGLRAEMRAILLRNALATLLFLLAGSIAIYIGVKRIMRPLTDLAESVRTLGAGGTVDKLPVESMDEIGRLAMDFNTMSDNLKRREEEKEALETKLRYAQKMEAVGTLARGVAHDFNNILATLRGSVYLIDRKLGAGDELRRHTTQVHDSISRAQNLIRELLTFSRTHQFELRPVDLNVVVRRLKPMLDNMAGEAVGLSIGLSDEPVMVMSDSVQIDQILMNLCTNGRDAMPDGGMLSITVGTVSVAPEETRSSYPPTPGGYGMITVSDTGPGMDEKTRERIFEPYFTTKDVGKGTGLGLAIVYGIVKQHRGWVWVDSEPGRGTMFKVYIPLLEKSGPDMENKSE
ncbi:MAG: ATP-binding protein [Nitrospiraceae bacterium]|nr:ATP-binding protein [Nitrospiraceae bacterium]